MKIAIIDAAFYEAKGLIEIMEVHDKGSESYKYYRERAIVLVENELMGWDKYKYLRKGETFDDGRFYLLAED